MSRLVLALVLAAALGGCASVPHPNPADPLEGFNRGVYRFNDAVDSALLKPVATAYRDHVPQLLRRGVANFFNNLDDAWSAVNHGLQAKPEPAVRMTMRFVTNSSFGIAGLFDVASDLGIDRDSEDFGQTLGYWGIGPGPFLMLPLLGPSTLRDTAALPLDRSATSLTNLGLHDADLVAGTGLSIVNARANLLGASNLMEQIALDRYTFLRDAYLARRRNQVYDGDPPPLPDEADPLSSKPAR